MQPVEHGVPVVGDVPLLGLSSKPEMQVGQVVLKTMPDAMGEYGQSKGFERLLVAIRGHEGHTARRQVRRYFPCRNIPTKFGAVEHSFHGRDVRYVPSCEASMMPRELAAIEHVGHVFNVANIPLRDVAIEFGFSKQSVCLVEPRDVPVIQTAVGAMHHYFDVQTHLKIAVIVNDDGFEGGHPFILPCPP